MNKFITTNKNLILTGLGIGMQVGGTLCAISATRTTISLAKEKEEKLGRPLTKKEFLTIALPYYVPTLILHVGGTVSTLIAANNYQSMVNSALLQAGTAYTALNTYKDKTKEVLGDKAKQKVDEAVAQQMVEDDADKYTPIAIPNESTVCLYKEPITKQEFQATWNEIEKAAISANKMAGGMWGTISVNDFLRELIKQPHTKGLETGNDVLESIGWRSGELIEPMPTACQKGCYVIGMIDYVREPSVIGKDIYS